MNHAEIKIRPARAEDARAITELAEELGYPNEIEAIRARIQAIAETDLLLVALDGDGSVVGFIQGHRVCIIEVGSRVEILGLVVSSKSRRGGVGRKLLLEVERWAAGLGVPVVSVRSNTKRTEAHVFYPAAGYNKIKTQAVYEKAMVSPR